MRGPLLRLKERTMPEVELQPKGTFKASEATPDPKLKDVALDKLQELIEWPTKMQEFVASQPPAPTPVPTEPVVAKPAEPAVVAPPVETPAEVPAVEPPAEVPDEAALLKHRLELFEVEQRKLEAKLAGRDAGETGYN